MKKVVLGFIIFLSIITCAFLSDNNTVFTVKAINYNGNSLRISIDDKMSDSLPTKGLYYLVDYDCSSANTVVTWDMTNYTLNVTNGTKSGSVACYLDFQSQPLLSDMPVGSYVKYVGNNGCNGNACEGQNANYVSDTEMGYCNDANYQFQSKGWRIAYVDGNNAYLISAGAPDCLCSNSNGSNSSSSCSDYVENYTDIYKHYDNMDKVALKYCNRDYAKEGICDSSTTWAMRASDFKKIVGSVLNEKTCYQKYSAIECGWTNDLIDIGSYYWIATAYTATSNQSYYWDSYYRYNGVNTTNNANGVRPILSLSSSVRVTGGQGTYKEPYTIIKVSNGSFSINGDADYVNSSNVSSVKLSLKAGSNVDSMCISVNTSVCTNYIEYNESYTLDWSNEGDGEKLVYVYYKDRVGEIVDVMYKSIILDTEAPINNSIIIGDAEGWDRDLALSSSGATYMCFSNTSNLSADCTNWISYDKNYYKWSLESGVGDRIVYAFFKDDAGNIAEVVSDSITVK